MNHPETFHIIDTTKLVASGRYERAMQTWCGVTPDYETAVYPQEARRIVHDGQQFPGYVRCEACFNRLMLADFEKTVRVED